MTAQDEKIVSLMLIVAVILSLTLWYISTLPGAVLPDLPIVSW